MYRYRSERWQRSRCVDGEIPRPDRRSLHAPDDHRQPATVVVVVVAAAGARVLRLRPLRKLVRTTSQPQPARPIRVRRRPKVRVSHMSQEVQAQTQSTVAHEDPPQMNATPPSINPSCL